MLPLSGSSVSFTMCKHTPAVPSSDPVIFLPPSPAVAPRPSRYLHPCDAPHLSCCLLLQGYAISAIQKVYAFQLSGGRPAPVTPEVRSFLEALCMSRSTDLQQRAYELQALLGLSAETVGAALPEDASCEDIEVGTARRGWSCLHRKSTLSAVDLSDCVG
jgi:hypothetical protein